MYNLLVTCADGAWDLPAYEFDRSRFLEGTAESIKGRFAKLTPEGIEDLMAMPTLFAYEDGCGELVRVGYIRKLRQRSHSIAIEYDFDEDIAPFDLSALRRLQIQLDIEGWERTRTHWAVKDENLFEILVGEGLVDGSYIGEGRAPGRVEEMRFKVALSFPGERREYVATVAAEVKRRLGADSVFYDRDFTAQLARPNLDTLLQQIYLKNADLVVAFLCADYERKEWCGLEWRAIREIIKNRADHSIMFMRFDGANVSGTFTIDGYVDLDHHTPVQAARMIVERVRLNDLTRRSED